MLAEVRRPAKYLSEGDAPSFVALLEHEGEAAHGRLKGPGACCWAAEMIEESCGATTSYPEPRRTSSAGTGERELFVSGLRAMYLDGGGTGIIDSGKH